MLDNPFIYYTVMIFGNYYLFFYFPCRLLFGFFLAKKFDKYIYPPIVFIGSSFNLPSIAGILRILKLLNIGKRAHSHLKALPLWLDVLAFIIPVSEIFFIIFFGSLYLIDKRAYF